jgi:epoxyqueuosine reductase
MQFDEGPAQLGPRREPPGEGPGVVFVGPFQDADARRGAGFYNRRVTRSCSQIDGPSLVASIGRWGRELGFSQIGVAGVDLSSAEAGLLQWLAAGFHGEMAYMQAHGLRRARPAELVPGTLSVITARMDYLPEATQEGWQAVEWDRLRRPREGAVSLYARGRDYHKVMRARLQKLAERIAREVGPFGHRAFTDSAPVLEAELAARSGQGWRGKHTLVLSREAGSMFFLGEIYVDLALPASEPVTAHCGNCRACIDICPTGAIVGEQRLDARRCISYLTIEHAGAIPVELRPLMGNRIYGCDDCQLVCPWNKYAQRSPLPDFDERPGFAGSTLAGLLGWREDEFLRRTEGSAIRRIGHERWLRNVAVAAGNALRAADDEALRAALRDVAGHPSAVVREHVAWALEQSTQRAGAPA